MGRHRMVGAGIISASGSTAAPLSIARLLFFLLLNPNVPLLREHFRPAPPPQLPEPLAPPPLPPPPPPPPRQPFVVRIESGVRAKPSAVVPARRPLPPAAGLLLGAGSALVAPRLAKQFSTEAGPASGQVRDTHAPLTHLLVALAAGSVSRGLLLPFHLLVSSELNGWRMLACRAISSVLLAAIASRAGMASFALRVALSAAQLAGVIGMAGGLSDNFGILTFSAMLSTVGYAALPIAQSMASTSGLPVPELAGRLGALAAINALGAASGVHLSLGSLGATASNSGSLATLLCASAAVVAATGYWALETISTKASSLEPVPRPPPPIRSTTLATPATPSLPLVRTWLPLSAAVAIGTVLEQRQTETLPPAQSSIDRLVDVSLRLVLQGFAARPLNAALGARNTVQLGCLLMALGALAAGMFSAPLAQLSAHHLLQSGLHVAEVGAATLVAVAANASRDPAAMRVCSLVAM